MDPSYRSYLEGQFATLRTSIDGIEARIVDTPLLKLPGISDLTKRLVARIRTPLDRARDALDEADEQLAVSNPFTLVTVARSVEPIRKEVDQAQWLSSTLSTLEAQRFDPVLSAKLERMDHLANLLWSAETGSRARKRWTLLWNNAPMVPVTMLGPGAEGLIPVESRHTETAAGWTQLARGLGFDFIAAHEGLLPELEKAAMVGPIADRRPPPHFFARSAFEADVAITRWIPGLVADLIGYHLLGSYYAEAIVEIAMRQGVRGVATTTIQVNQGLYHYEAPLMCRLEAIRAVARREDVGTRQLVEETMRRLEIPEEARYVLPNQHTRRLQLGPLIDFVGVVAQSLLDTSYPALHGRRLLQAMGMGLGSADVQGVHAATAAFVRGELPFAEPLVLLRGALGAEQELPGNSFAVPLQRALVQKPKRARRQRRREGAVSDRALMREALVLSEIL
jgi:hypothetical protein